MKEGSAKKRPCGRGCEPVRKIRETCQPTNPIQKRSPWKSIFVVAARDIRMEVRIDSKKLIDTSHHIKRTAREVFMEIHSNAISRKCCEKSFNSGRNLACF